jgi:hypothetical protein
MSRQRKVTIEGNLVNVTGLLVRTARLRSEHYVFLEDPVAFIAEIKRAPVAADIFTFLQPFSDPNPKYHYHLERDDLAVLKIDSYERWWTKQIKDKTRNMVRKAQKTGVEVRLVEFTDELVRKIKDIYDESFLRQGQPFKHYGKDLETLKKDHATFIERSDFIGAFWQEEMIGFVKLVHGQKASSLMQIVSKVAHRDKAATNALIAKAVEICAGRNIPYLHYGIWARRGLNDFKRHHGFEPFQLPRYYVPLTLRGHLVLRFKLHRNLLAYVPGSCIDVLANLRTRWYMRRYGQS